MAADIKKDPHHQDTGWRVSYNAKAIAQKLFISIIDVSEDKCSLYRIVVGNEIALIIAFGHSLEAGAA